MFLSLLIGVLTLVAAKVLGAAIKARQYRSIRLGLPRQFSWKQADPNVLWQLQASAWILRSSVLAVEFAAAAAQAVGLYRGQRMG